ncbi:MAG: lipopolysaccharide biosynthesis protein [Proteobacteria bacterium]|nr:lipopolysaccharide biosynthesis protein [Pseudomonadota bacterium]MBU4259998.1 lipopolysaccharide biosynthesis protein [Pseudomonadota bacterium]MBU4287837.1 lipopolysaccharide biosynthesis protein [Pseudomonadota bacterium]MCG2829908.1 lipopolysaccharide biosynthesis protein [Desulfobacteraceae bacterium]
MNNLKNKFVKSVLWVASAKFVGQAFSWLVTIILIRLLSPKDFGIVAMVSAYHAIIVIFYDLSLGQALIQKKDLKPREIQTVLWAVPVAGALLYAFSFIFAPYVAAFFKNEQIAMVLRVYTIGIIFQSAQEVPYCLLSKQFDFDKRAKAEFISNVISMLVSLILAYLEYGVWSLVFGFLAKTFSQAILIFYFFEWKSILTPKQPLTFSCTDLYALLKFSLPLTGFYSLRFLFMRSDSVIVGRWLGDKSLGYYSVALDLARMPVDKFITILNQVCFPLFAELQDDLEALQTYFFKILKFVALIVFPISIGAAILSKEMVYLILTPKWSPIINPFICLCFVAILQSLAGIIFMLINALGKSRINFVFSLISAILLPISFLITVRYGLLAVAMSWVVVYTPLFLYLIHLTNSQIDSSFRRFAMAIKSPLFAVLSMALSVSGLKMIIGLDIISFQTMFLYIFVGATTYITYIYLFSPQTIGEIKGIYFDLRSSRDSRCELAS